MELEARSPSSRGAGNGIGAALCRRFGAEGAAGVAVVDLDRRRPSPSRTSWGIGMGLAADVSREAEIVETIRSAGRGSGQVDLLVCNAGIGSGGGVEAPDAAVAGLGGARDAPRLGCACGAPLDARAQ